MLCYLRAVAVAQSCCTPLKVMLAVFCSAHCNRYKVYHIISFCRGPLDIDHSGTLTEVFVEGASKKLGPYVRRRHCHYTNRVCCCNPALHTIEIQITDPTI